MIRFSSGLLFWLILSAGTLMVTVGYILLQAPGTAVPFGPDVHLSEADKVYIDQMTEQTKWLESLAYASLAGLIVLQGKGSGAGLSKITSVGAALLIVSLYAGFLSRDVILIALTKGAPLLYSTLGTWPHTTQFWCLIVGLALLARDFLWTKKLAVPAAVATGLLLPLLYPTSLRAQDPPGPSAVKDVSTCTGEWAQSRFSKMASPQDQVLMTDFLNRTAQRANVPSSAAGSCDFAYSTMDKVRNASNAIYGKDTLADTIVLAGSLRDQLSANAAAPSTFLATLINSMDVWHWSTGSISIETKRSGADVKINQQFVGPAPLLYIAKPGNYAVQVSFGGVVLAQQSITVVANVRSVVTVP
jgi:hypothetical protein